MRRARPLALILPLALLSVPAHALVWPDVPERIERGLASQDPASRRAAARELSTLGPARATPLVLKAMGDQDTEVRLAGAQSAIRLHVASATDVAIQWLGERDAKLRVAACEVALSMPAARAVPALARALGDADAQVRGACADALGAQASPDAVAPLSGKLDDPTPAVRSQVARALAKLGDPRAVVPLVGKVQDSVPEVRQAVVRALGDLGDTRATQALLLALRDNVTEVKVEALAALGHLRAPEAAAAIAPLALERNPSVRQAALVALGRIATPDAVRALVKALGTQDDAGSTLERTSVRDALVASGQAAVTELTALLERPTPPAVATSAAWVLGELKATKSAHTIVSALRKGTLPAAGALRALAGAGTADEVPVVLEFVGDPSPVVREEALRAATALLDPARPDGRAVEPLAAMLRAPRTSPGERAAVATLLGRTGAPRAATELAGLVASKDNALRLAAIDALGALGAARAAGGDTKAGDPTTDDALVPLLGDPDPTVRLRSSVALASSGGPKARGALLGKLDGGDEVDRFAVLAALGGIVERHPEEAAAKRLWSELAVAAGPERDAVLEAAGRARLPSTVAALADLASKGDADDRRMVASMLAVHRGSAQASSVARALSADADASVRAQATFTLGALGDATSLSGLATLAKSGDNDVATNAAGAIARLAATLGASASTAIAGVACPMLADGRATVRANALVALAASRARCGDGRTERKLLADDASDLVRGAAARAIGAAPTADDRTALDRSVSADRSAEVARLCRPRVSSSTVAPPRSVTIFVIGESGNAAKPRGPFLLEYEGGVLRAGTADRRGATFEAAAPAGDLTLRRAPGR
ncbi:MAG: HEAT repeat domain-containing protein [Deltaproteobacteria bacterium]|nr:HEAT repeat domain-containing protein [Deltaproteobacteria bacterium]